MKVARIYESLTDLIGKTPLLELKRYSQQNNIKAKIIAKLEYFNPAGSVKDRIAYAMIIDAEEKGLLKEGSVIIEPTSGNTGIGLASVGAARGYKVILTMPDTMSIERRNLLKAYGAQVVLTDGQLAMSGAIAKAKELLKEIPNSYMPDQFSNMANPQYHKITTGPEIWEDTDGKVDIFIAGIGTGGTLSGVGEYLKSKNKDIKIIGMEPFDSPVISGGKPGSHGLQGLGAGFIPDTLDTKIYDEIITIKTSQAYSAAKALSKAEGLLVGISSGAALAAANIVASRAQNHDKNIVVLLPDTGERYLSTDLFND